MPGTFSPPPRVSDPDIHHGTCMPGLLTSGFLWSPWWGKRSRHSRRMRNRQFYVPGKRPMAISPFIKTQSSDVMAENDIWFQTAKFVGPTWGPPGSSRPQMGPMLAPWTCHTGHPTLDPPTAAGIHRWVTLCMWVVHSRLMSFFVPAGPDLSKWCSHSFLELPDGCLSDAWCNTDSKQELCYGLTKRTTTTGLHWIHLAFPTLS